MVRWRESLRKWVARERNWQWWTVTALAVALLLGTLLPLIPSTAGMGRWHLPVLQTVVPLIAPMALIGIAIALWRSNLVAAVASTLALVAALLPVLHWKSPDGCEIYSTDDGGRVSLLSFNAYVGQADVFDLSRKVIDHDVDVLVLTETDNAMLKRFKATAGGKRLVNHTTIVRDDGFSGSTIMSRYPLTTVPGAGHGTATAWFDQPAAQVSVNGIPVLIQAVHPYPPMAQADSWDSSLRALGAWQQKVPDQQRLILAGDFNATWAHPAFRAATTGMRNAGPSRGPFEVPTWPRGSTVPAFATIDHIMVRELTVKTAKRLDISGSDHYAVWSQLNVCHGTNVAA